MIFYIFFCFMARNRTILSILCQRAIFLFFRNIPVPIPSTLGSPSSSDTLIVIRNPSLVDIRRSWGISRTSCIANSSRIRKYKTNIETKTTAISRIAITTEKTIQAGSGFSGTRSRVFSRIKRPFSRISFPRINISRIKTLKRYFSRINFSRIKFYKNVKTVFFTYKKVFFHV